MILNDNKADHCKQCLNNHAMVKVFTGVNERNVCINMVSEMNCLKPVLVRRIDGKFEIDCNSCDQTNALVNTVITPTSVAEITRHRCAKIDVILHCSSYSYSANNSKVTCITCRPNFWYDSVTNKCKSRTIISDCETYQPSSDKCLKCNATHVLYSNSSKCRINPAGEVSCEKYDSNGTQCMTCKPNSYLSGNTCVSTIRINNCKYYSAENRCTACDNSDYQM